MDYRISSLESDVGRIRDELRSMSSRVFDLELERECKKQRREALLQALLVSFSAILFWLSLIAAIPGHRE